MTRCIAGVAVFLAATVTSALAQDYPTRPITLVVPFTPGGVYDTMGRVYASALADILGTPVVVENVPGAGSMTGAARVARAGRAHPRFGYGAPLGEGWS